MSKAEEKIRDLHATPNYSTVNSLGATLASLNFLGLKQSLDKQFWNSGFFHLFLCLTDLFRLVDVKLLKQSHLTIFLVMFEASCLGADWNLEARRVGQERREGEKGGHSERNLKCPKFQHTVILRTV